jgi:hypothetical protein
MKLLDGPSAADGRRHPVEWAVQEFARRTWPGESLEPGELEWLSARAASALNADNPSPTLPLSATHARMMAALEVARWTPDLELRRWARRGWLELRTRATPVTCRVRLRAVLGSWPGELWYWARVDRAARHLARIWSAGEPGRIEVEDLADATLGTGLAPAHLLRGLARALHRARRDQGRDGPVEVLLARS